MPMSNLTTNEQTVVKEFCRDIQARWGARILATRLFGSRARGEGNEDSDIDILVLVDRADSNLRQDIYGAPADYLLKYEVVLSPLVMDKQQYDSMKSRERLLIQEIERDGIAI